MLRGTTLGEAVWIAFMAGWDETTPAPANVNDARSKRSNEMYRRLG
jgi:hypothetical protein